MPASLVYLFLLTGFIVLALAPWGALAEMVRTLLFAAVPLLAAAAVWFTGLQLLVGPAGVPDVPARAVDRARRGRADLLRSENEPELGVRRIWSGQPHDHPRPGLGRGHRPGAARRGASPFGAAGRRWGKHRYESGLASRPARRPSRSWLACGLRAENRPAAPRVPTVLLEVTYDIDDAPAVSR